MPSAAKVEATSLWLWSLWREGTSASDLGDPNKFRDRYHGQASGSSLHTTGSQYPPLLSCVVLSICSSAASMAVVFGLTLTMRGLLVLRRNVANSPTPSCVVGIFSATSR